MRIIKHKYYEEVWGAKVPVYEYEVDTTPDEVFDEVLGYVIDDGYFPETMEVCDDYEDTCVDINTRSYLNSEQEEFLDNLVEIVENYTPVKCKPYGKYYLIDIDEKIPEGCKELEWSEMSLDYIDKIVDNTDKFIR